MKRVQTLFAEHRARIAAHPFFDWLQDPSLPAKDRFSFTPLMVDFTMGFADMNKWFLGYENPQNELERSINQHTLEDRTHSRLFLENWHAFALDDQLGWSASQTLWWLYHSPETLPVRRFGWDILRLSVQFPDPLVRFALMEAIEICGDVFFGNTKRVAAQLSRHTGIEYRYYGEYHHLRETGHLHTDESPFFAAKLSEQQLARANNAVTTIFRGFEQVLDHLLDHGRRFSTRTWLAAAKQGDSALQSRKNLVQDRNPFPGAACATQAPLIDFLQERQQQLARHPFVDWLRNAALDDTEKLRRFSALWAVDIAGYPDFNHFALCDAQPSGATEQALNDWAHSLASHGIVYLQDWRTLDLDRHIDWSAGDTIAFYFLSELSELHRRNLAKVTRFAFEDRSPLWRWWLMTAFEAGGDPLFDALRPVVQNAERSTGPLSYWAERHSHRPFEAAQRAHLQTLLDQPIDTGLQHRLSGMIGTLFDGFEQQLTLSHRLATQGSFVTRPASLLPARQQAPMLASAQLIDEAAAK